jgi:hypothetical protein
MTAVTLPVGASASRAIRHLMTPVLARPAAAIAHLDQLRVEVV